MPSVFGESAGIANVHRRDPHVLAGDRIDRPSGRSHKVQPVDRDVAGNPPTEKDMRPRVTQLLHAAQIGSHQYPPRASSMVPRPVRATFRKPSPAMRGACPGDAEPSQALL